MSSTEKFEHILKSLVGLLELKWPGENTVSPGLVVFDVVAFDLEKTKLTLTFVGGSIGRVILCHEEHPPIGRDISVVYLIGAETTTVNYPLFK